MNKKLTIISINYDFQNSNVVHESLDSDRTLFDFDIVVIRPPQFNSPVYPINNRALFQQTRSLMDTKKRELKSFFSQGGVLVVFLDVPNFYRVKGDRYGVGDGVVSNYDFLDSGFAGCLRKGSGKQITYKTIAEPFVTVLKKSTVVWTAYLTALPRGPLEALKFFASAGAGGQLGGKMPYGEGHLVILPNVVELDEGAFFDACAEYRFKRQGTTPPDWVSQVVVPGLQPIEDAMAALDRQIEQLQTERRSHAVGLEEMIAYRKLLYEKGKAQLEPIVLRSLDDLDFGTSPSEIIAEIHEIDGRTSNGSSPGVVEVKGSKNQIAQSEFSPFVTKILADAEVNNGKYSKGILVGNGLCETEPGKRLGDAVFSPHVQAGAKLNSIALINSVELYWLCCALLRGDLVDKNVVREAILTGNGYVDLKPFSGQAPF